jgi:hypothetical protein
MSEESVADPHPPERARSLIGQLWRRIGRRPHDPAALRNWQITGLVGLVCLIVALAIVAAVSGGQARRLRAEATALTERSAAAAQARDRLSAFAAAAARPPIDAELTRLAAHLPGDVRLIQVSRDEAGMLSLVIDSPDPDLLRESLAGDPVLGRLTERAQERRDDGSIRVRLEGEIG